MCTPSTTRLNQRELTTLEDQGNVGWRVALRKELEAWYAVHAPAGRRSKSQGGADSFLTAVAAKKLVITQYTYSDEDDPNEAVAAFCALEAACRALVGSGAAAVDAAAASAQ